MHYAHLTEQIRRCARSRMESLGAEPKAEMIETILIRDGHYCGRRFECDGFCAVWFVEENQVKFYERDGGVAAAHSVNHLLYGATEQRRAA